LKDTARNPGLIPCFSPRNPIEKFHGAVGLIDGGPEGFLFFEKALETPADFLLAHLHRRSAIMTDKMHHALEVTADRFGAEVF
jgi:hypothetical protein